jgi:hypothetical protein
METKLIAMIVGVALVFATAATVYTQSAFALGLGFGSNGVRDGQQAHGLANACTHSAVAEHNTKHCGGQTPTGGAVITRGGGSTVTGSGSNTA